MDDKKRKNSDNGASSEEWYQRGLNAQKSKKYKQALDCFLKAATMGHAEAQHSLGLMYWQGKGTTKKFTDAFKWVSKAAEQGNIAAATDLGFFYKNGIGVSKSNTRALQWYRTAAENGDPNGQFNYGYMFFYGNGVKQNYNEALKWFTKAAEQDNIDASYYTGLIYEEGYGISADLAQAKKWYELGAAAGNKDCQDGLERIGAADAIEELYNIGKTAHAAKDYSKAMEYLNKAALQGHAGAHALIGCMYMEGEGCAKNFGLAQIWLNNAEKLGYTGCKDALERLQKAETSARKTSIGNSSNEKPGEEWFKKGMAARGAKNYAQALDYFLKAAAQGHMDAQSWLGWMYSSGQGTTKNNTEAFKWTYKAAEQGHTGAAVNLGYFYRNGIGVAKSDVQALQWYRKAAEKGAAPGQFNYGFMFYYGYGVKKDYAEALRWFTKAANQNYKDAFSYLGDIYEKGYGVTKNLEKAKSFYQKGVNLGVDFCKKALQRLNDAESAAKWHWDAEMAFIKMQYGTAMQLYKKAAKAGHADSAYDLALMYYEGKGVIKDKRIAGQWFHKAATLGNGDAQFQVGFTCYKHKEYISAVEWYEKAAKNGNIKALYYLGVCFHYGGISPFENVECNYNEAIRLYKECESKTPDKFLKSDCQHQIGECYEFGLNNIAEARKWYQLSDSNYNRHSIIALQQIEMIEKDTSGPESWFHKGEHAMWNITIEEYNGSTYTCWSLSWDIDRYYEAMRWWHKAAVYGHTEAQYNLARYIYQQGKAGPKSQVEALKWFTAAANRGHRHSQAVLVNKYKYGDGALKDLQESARWQRILNQNR